METKTLFKKYYARLQRIGIVKSLILAIIVGFAVNFIAAFITWFTDLGIWAVLGISIGAGLIAAAVSMPIFYSKLFRPTTQKVAALIDRLGLQERMITMHEFENDDSYIAMRQREDAKEKLSNVNTKQLRYNLSKALIIVLAVVCVLGLSMTTVTALAATGTIQGGGNVVGEIIPGPGKDDPNDPNLEEEPIYFTLTYVAGEGGRISGPTVQQVEMGKNAKAVRAVPDEGFEFVQWSDQRTSSSRWDLNVQEDMTLEATFRKKQDPNGPGIPGSGGTSGGDPSDQEGEGEGEGDAPDGDENSKGNPDGIGAPDRFDAYDNTVIDGQTSYKDDFDYNDAMEEMTNNDTLPDELKDIIGNYYESMK